MFRKRLLRGFTEINNDISKLETPHERITTRTYLIMTLTLIGVVIIFWNIIRNDQADIRAECKERNKANNIKIDRQQIEIDSLKLKYRVDVDSLKYRIYEVEKEMYENRLETVNQRKALINRAKQLLKR